MPAHAVASCHYSKFPWLGTIFHVDEKKQSNFNQIKINYINFSSPLVNLHILVCHF